MLHLLIFLVVSKQNRNTIGKEIGMLSMTKFKLNMCMKYLLPKRNLSTLGTSNKKKLVKIITHLKVYLNISCAMMLQMCSKFEISALLYNTCSSC